MAHNNLNFESETEIRFFTPQFHPFDNFSAHAVEVWGKKFATAEHAFQWKKYATAHPELAEKIFKAPSSSAVKKISDSHKHLQPVTWKDDKVGVMREILAAKAEQHEDVKELLKKSGDRTIIENSPFDSFWGIGPDGNGQNMVGKIWMDIRAQQK